MRALLTHLQPIKLAVFLAALVYAPAQFCTQYAQVITRGELRVGILTKLSPRLSDALPPSSSIDRELVACLAKYLGLEVRLNTYDNPDDLFASLEGGAQNDIIIGGLPYSSNRITHYRTGPSSHIVAQQLVYRRGGVCPPSLGEVRSPINLAADSASVLHLPDWNLSHPNIHWQINKDFSVRELLHQVADGKLTYAVADSMTVALLQQTRPQLAVAFEVAEEHPVVWYLSKQRDKSLLTALTNFFQLAAKHGTISRLKEKYFGHMAEFDYVDITSFIRAIERRLPKFRHLFKKYETAEFPWQLLAAIAYQESHWNPLAVSPTGVRGLMMLTRSTAQSMGVVDRLDAEQSIRGAVLYLQYLSNRLPQTIRYEERLWFALAAYNIGPSHLMNARYLTRSRGGNADSWMDVKATLPLLKVDRELNYSASRGAEAVQFVDNIRRYRQSLEGYLNSRGQN